MARGLRQKFGIFANDIAGVIVEKFKEKKKVLLDELVLCIDAVFESSNLDSLSETIQSALAKPNPQIKAQTSQFLYRIFYKFSPANVPNKNIKFFAPTLVKLLSEPDPEVRDASSAALGAIMRLIHEKNMATLVGDVASDKIKWTKIIEYKEKAEQDYVEWLASQPKTASLEPGSSTNGTDLGSEASVEVDGSQPKEVDPWEFLEPSDIMKELSKSFFEDVQSKKWQERKDALEALLGLLIANPRLCTNGQYSEVIATLKGVIKNDANINVASVAVKCIANLATGLRRAFQPYTTSLTPIILEKFKEKKPVLKDPLVECIDAIYMTTHLENLNEHIAAALANKNPSVKIQTCLFLYRVFKNLRPTTTPKKQIKILTPVIVKLTVDPDPEVREAAFTALGAIMKAVGKSAATPLLGEVAQDKLKMAKIEEFHDKAMSEANPNAVTPLQLEQAAKEQDNPQKEPAGQPKNVAKSAQNGTTSKPFSKPPQGIKPAPPKKAPAPNLAKEENGHALEKKPTSYSATIKTQSTISKPATPAPYVPAAAHKLKTTGPTPSRPMTAPYSERSKSQTMMSRVAVSNAVVSSGYGKPQNGPTRPVTSQQRPSTGIVQKAPQVVPRVVNSRLGVTSANRANSESTLNSIGQPRPAQPGSCQAPRPPPTSGNPSSLLPKTMPTTGSRLPILFRKN
uniref:TOG domain-containing protein n=1 Tax=Acrobeloides nanus TaxID=290746 RepID=A0A914CYG4_9BILA